MLERERKEVQPYEAVADAVMVAIYRQLYKYGGIEGLDKGLGSPFDLETITRLATKGTCREAGDMVITYLKEKYPDLFEKRVLIEALSCKEAMLKNDWGWHDYFLVLGRDGVWYAGSPANYLNGLAGYEGEMTKIISSESLEEVMAEITRLEHGQWPEPMEIIKILFGLMEEEEGCVPIIHNQSGKTGFRWCNRPPTSGRPR